MGDNAGDRPGGESVFRGKRCASRSEAAGVRFVRTRSLESQFHGLAHDYRVDRRFTRQEPSLAAVVVIGGCSARIQGRSASDHGCQSVVAKTVAAGNWGVSQMPHDVRIGRNQAQGANAEGREPVSLSISSMQMQRTRPDRFLIRGKILPKLRQAKTGRHAFLSRTICSQGIRSGRRRRTAVLSLADTSLADILVRTPARTQAGTRSLTFGSGCPACASRPSDEQSDGHRRAKMPPEFVEEKHTLAVGGASETRIRACLQAYRKCIGIKALQALDLEISNFTTGSRVAGTAAFASGAGRRNPAAAGRGRRTSLPVPNRLRRPPPPRFA